MEAAHPSTMATRFIWNCFKDKLKIIDSRSTLQIETGL